MKDLADIVKPVRNPNQNALTTVMSVNVVFLKWTIIVVRSFIFFFGNNYYLTLYVAWVSNCVGFYNHRYFVLFLFYLWLGCSYVAIMSFQPFRSTTNFKIPWRGWSSRGTIIFTFVITISISLAVGFMLLWQLYLAMTGQTTIEFYYNQYMSKKAANRGDSWQNPYNLGIRKNLHLFFGPSRFIINWFLPSNSPPPGDGISYITKSQTHTV